MKVLLHVCCAPCSIAVIDEMRHATELAVFFYNPNIFPEEEYLKRKNEVIRVCREWEIPMVDADFETEIWEGCVGRLGESNEKGERCRACFGLRLGRTAAEAKAGRFDAFATSLTMGRLKSSPTINEIGRQIAEAEGIGFIDEDWKKKGRWEKGRAMTLGRGIYRQNYCGCRFSMRQAVTASRAEMKKAAP